MTDIVILVYHYMLLYVRHIRAYNGIPIWQSGRWSIRLASIDASHIKQQYTPINKWLQTCNDHQVAGRHTYWFIHRMHQPEIATAYITVWAGGYCRIHTTDKISLMCHETLTVYGWRQIDINRVNSYHSVRPIKNTVLQSIRQSMVMLWNHKIKKDMQC